MKNKTSYIVYIIFAFFIICLEQSRAEDNLLWQKIATSKSTLNPIFKNANNGKYLITYDYKLYDLAVWDYETGDLINFTEVYYQNKNEDNFPVENFFIKPNSDTLLAYLDDSIYYIKIPECQLIKTYGFHEYRIKDISLNWKYAVNQEYDYVQKKFTNRFNVFGLDSQEIIYQDTAYYDELNSSYAMRQMFFTKDENFLIIRGGPNDKVTIFDINMKKRVWRDSLNEGIEDVAVSDNMKYLILSGDKKIYIYDFKTKELLYTYEYTYEYPVNSISTASSSITKDNKYLITYYEDWYDYNSYYMMITRNIETGEVISNFSILDIFEYLPYNKENYSLVEDISLAYDDKNLLAVTYLGVIKIDLFTGKLTNIYSTHSVYNSDNKKIYITKDCKYLISFGGYAIVFWDLKDGHFIKCLRIDSMIDFIKNTGELVYIIDNKVIFYSLEKNEITKEYDLPVIPVQQSYSDDGKYICFEHGDNEIMIWDFEKGEELFNEKFSNDSYDISFSKEGKYCAVSQCWDYLAIIDVEKGKIVKILTEMRGHVEFFSDSNIILCYEASDYNKYIMKVDLKLSDPDKTMYSVLDKYNYTDWINYRNYIMTKDERKLITCGLFLFDLDTKDTILLTPNKTTYPRNIPQDFLSLSSDNKYLAAMTKFYATIMVFDVEKYLTSVDDNNIQINELSLSCVPNPVETLGNISYSQKSNNFISLEVYDLLGRKISTIFEGYKEIGNYRFQYDFSNYSTGNYVLLLKSKESVKAINIGVIK